MVYKRQNKTQQKIVPGIRKKNKFKHASPSSGREKILETMSWRRVPKQKFVSKVCVQKASHYLTEPDSTMEISVVIYLFIGFA